MQKLVKTLIIIGAALFLAACEEKPKPQEGVGRYGMMADSTPEYNALMYFQHLYNDEGIDGVLAYSTPRMARLVQSYRTPRQVQRHLINLMYDDVSMDIDTGNDVGRNEYAEQATVTVFFTGRIHGDKREDLRTVELVRVDGEWKVDKIKADIYG